MAAFPKTGARPRKKAEIRAALIPWIRTLCIRMLCPRRVPTKSRKLFAGSLRMKLAQKFTYALRQAAKYLDTSQHAHDGLSPLSNGLAAVSFFNRVQLRFCLFNAGGQEVAER